ncbi:hypothetical protein EKK58_00605 [Candidatus Dependentiae bacterium]|nr:MAG: hypothetical protein EKK58_00605 [Candidatus Dependentiae bacterium]
MNSKCIGDISESAVLAALVAKGKTVLTPFGDKNRYDLVVEEEGHFRRLQVKTGRLRDGVIMFSTHSSTRQKGQRVETSYVGQIEEFAVYCPETKEVYLVPIDECGHTRVQLRVAEERLPNKLIKRANKYKL